MYLTREQCGQIEAWMVERQNLFAMTRKPATHAWSEYRAGGGLNISMAQFYRILLYARCKGVVKFWRGRPQDLRKQLLLWPDV